MRKRRILFEGHPNSNKPCSREEEHRFACKNADNKPCRFLEKETLICSQPTKMQACDVLTPEGLLRWIELSNIKEMHQMMLDDHADFLAGVG